MRVIELTGFGIANLAAASRPDPVPGPGEALVRLAAASLNYRDLLVVEGRYNPKQPVPIVPLSDGAGTVAAVGPGVADLRPGDRVVAAFFEGWLAGEPTSRALATSRGAMSRDGVYCEYRVFPAAALLAVPDYLSDVEAATLPCAAVTAWNAVVGMGQVRPGDTVLVQGTGGVSLFALQFAKLVGAKVIVLSSSDAKLERARALGADHGINYREVTEWGRAVWPIVGEHGVDLVVEVGGAATLAQSLRVVRPGGTVSLIGVLGGPTIQLSLPHVVMQQVRLQGVTVGSRADFAAMLRAMTLARLRPAVDQVFDFADARAAYERMAKAEHLGKICVRLGA